MHAHKPIQKSKWPSFLGYGILDLEDKLLRTPDNAAKILLEDPLRLFRAVRFASTLGFRMEKSLYDACKSAEVQSAIDTKVTVERRGAEVVTMLKSESCAKAMLLLEELHLLPHAFPIANEERLVSKEWYKEGMVYLRKGEELMRYTIADRYLHFANFMKWCKLEEKPRDRIILRLAAFLLPLMDALKTNRNTTEIATLFSTAVPLGRDYSILVESCQDFAFELLPYTKIATAAAHKKRFANACRRVELGLLLRYTHTMWPLSLILLWIYYDCKSDERYPLECIIELIEEIRDLKLDTIMDLKQHLNGSDILNQFKNVERAKIGEMLEAQVAWILQYPNGTKEQCLQFLKQTYSLYL